MPAMPFKLPLQFYTVLIIRTMNLFHSSGMQSTHLPNACRYYRCLLHFAHLKMRTNNSLTSGQLMMAGPSRQVGQAGQM